MVEEFNVVEEQGTWIFVPHAPTVNVVAYEWVYRTQYNFDGFIARYKARLVAKGYNQIKDFNFS